MPQKSHRDPAQEITDYFVARLAEGHRPWVKPWTPVSSPYPLRATGEAYKGMNRFWLDIVGSCAGYASPYWMTYNQAKSLGGQVRKGESSQFALFYKQGVKQATPENPLLPATDNDKSQSYRILRSYAVFNADQIDNLPAKFLPDATDFPALLPHERQSEIDTYIDAIPATISYGGNRACFRPAHDDIQMPIAESFKSYDHFAATKLHEIGHWTGAKPRLNRSFGRAFGDELYAAEELVAEMFSHLAARRLGLPDFIHHNSVAYIASWIKILKADKNALLSAASKAQAAFDYIEQFHDVETNQEKERARAA